MVEGTLTVFYEFMDHNVHTQMHQRFLIFDNFNKKNFLCFIEKGNKLV